MEKMLIGTVSKAQGIKGEVKIAPITDDNSRFVNLKKVFVNDIEFEVECGKDLVNGVYIKLKGIDDRNSAELLRGAKLYVLRKDAKVLEDGRYYITDLIGCEIFSEGILLGVLKEIFQNGSADVYSVVGERNFMFPALKSVLLSVDIEKKIINLDAQKLSEIAVYED